MYLSSLPNTKNRPIHRIMKSIPSQSHIKAWARLIRISDHLLRSVEADLKAQGHPNLSVYDALLELNRKGETGLRPYELEQEMLLPQYNISRLVTRLSDKGYIRRTSVKEDGRGQTLHITQSGKDLLKAMWPDYARAIERHIGSKINTQEARQMCEILQKLRDPK